MQQKPPQKDEQRNLIIAAALSFGVLLLWQVFYIDPQVQAQREAEEQRREALIEQGIDPDAIQAEGASGATPGIAGAFGGALMDRETALAQSQRIQIETPRITGSISLAGGRLDELKFTDYREALDPNSPDVELLWPRGMANAYFAEFGWAPIGGVATPSDQTEWVRAPGSPQTLTPQTPVTLLWDNGAGVRFLRRIAVDEDFLFTVRQTVVNSSGQSIRLAPYATVTRHGLPERTGFFVLHEGPIAVFDGSLNELDYEDLDDAPRLEFGGRGEIQDVEEAGWLGFTDKYWMTALTPAQQGPFTAQFDTVTGPFGQPIYRAAMLGGAREIANGAETSIDTRLFAGAKEISVIRDYQYLFDGTIEPDSFFGKLSDFFFYSSPTRFIDSIDWGWFFFLTKPTSEILFAINGVVGNMGLAIILLTVLFKTLVLPLAYKSYVSMSMLKKLQPEMKKIQERAGEDRMQMQQEMMALYKREKVNPAAGCLPILIQIPIFFSLYKVLFVTIEMRHAPFFGWIQDLSAPDPTSIFNLFGLLPFDTPLFLTIGIWPILMGITMWLQQMLNPAPTDPMQEKIFNLLPLLFTFLLGTFMSGLVIYWTANNVLTIIQQYLIMRSQGVKPDILGNIKRQLGLAPKEGQA